MKPRRFIIFLSIIFITVLSNFSYAQKDEIKINQLDSLGRKDGYWIDTTEHLRKELYYRNGKLHGMTKYYNRHTNCIDLIEEYDNGKPSGIWYTFGDLGRIIGLQKDFKKNTDVIVFDSGRKHIFKNRCYFVIYHTNGRKESEGILLYDEYAFSDLSHEFGEWKYYDESEKLIRTKTFK